MQKYTEYQKLNLNQQILNLSEEDGQTFSEIYDCESKSHATGLVAALFTFFGVPFFYLGFNKFKTWIIVAWVAGLLLSYIYIGFFIIIALEYYLVIHTWSLIEDHNYQIKEHFLNYNSQKIN